VTFGIVRVYAIFQQFKSLSGSESSGEKCTRKERKPRLYRAVLLDVKTLQKKDETC
jgi:hypothetical protein